MIEPEDMPREAVELLLQVGKVLEHWLDRMAAQAPEGVKLSLIARIPELRDGLVVASHDDFDDVVVNLYLGLKARKPDA